MCQKSPERRKVGDTLTATVEPADAKVTYSWSINGTVYATSESITVPASAAYGDRISVTVTAEDGETATDMVFVGGFTIVEVEPTTANDGGDYKYIRATFSTALSSLDPSEIEIRRKSDKQLYSVESVRLSSDGKVADITLFGNKLEAGTEFLTAATIYVMTVTHDGFTDDLEFQLPANERDLIVTSVDTAKGTIFTVVDGRTNPAVDTRQAGLFTVGDAYLGNLGYLVGRNVIVGSNADRELMNFSVEDQNVVIAKVKYAKKDNADNNKNYFETPDGTKYFLNANDTTTVAATQLYWADDGTQIVIGNLQDKDEFQYAKLVLNRNGTIATGMLQGATAWSGHIIVTTTDEKQVIESEDFALDFDGYTIVKDDEYVEVSDLEAGDVCYYNSTDKFVDVYAESVTGNIDKITSEEITLDGTAYKWPGAQYLKSNKYATLAGTADTIESDLAYLYSLDEDADTTLVLNRKGEVQIIDGTVKDEAKTTSSIYVLTEDGASYEIGKTFYLELNGSNGTQEKLVIDASKVKKYENKDAKITAGTNPKTQFKLDGTDKTTAAEFPDKQPVKITKDEDGNVIEIRKNETAPILGNAKDANNNDQTINSDSTSLYKDATHKATLTSSTPVYILDDKADDDGVEPWKVTKTTLGELEKTAKADKVTAYVKSSSTKAEFIVIDNTAGNAWTTSDTETIGGVVTKVTKGLNTSSGKEEVETVEVLTASGKVELDSNELGFTTDYTLGNYATFTVKKGTYTIAKEAANANEFKYMTLDGLRAYSDTKFTSQDGQTTVSKAATAGVFVYDADAKSYTATTIGAVTTKQEEATLAYHVVDENTENVVTSDMMVVTYSGLENPATVTLSSSALAEALTPTVGTVLGTIVGTAEKSNNSALTSVTYKLQFWNTALTTPAWDYVTNGTLTYNSGNLVVGTTAPTVLGNTKYRIEAAGAPTAKFATVYSNVVKTEAAAAATVTVTGGYGTSANKLSTAAGSNYHAATLTVKDQYGNLVTTGVTLTGASHTTLTNNGDGTWTATAATVGTDTITGVGTGVSLVVEAPVAATASLNKTSAVTATVSGAGAYSDGVVFADIIKVEDQFGENWTGAVTGTAAVDHGSGAGTVTVASATLAHNTTGQYGVTFTLATAAPTTTDTITLTVLDSDFTFVGAATTPFLTDGNTY